MKDRKVPINEMYTCIQGEGKLTGVPHILIRFSGCRLRCQFANSVCDTWYSSWNPEKGKFTLGQVEEFIKKYPHISHVMITGGGPTLQKKWLPIIVALCKENDKFITLETEGSEFVPDIEIDLLSLSPKLKSSTPRLDSYVPELDRYVTQRDIDQHEKWRTQYDAMKSLLGVSHDHQLKPVVSCEKDLQEVRLIQAALNVPNNKVYLMLPGVTDEQLNEGRKWLEEVCIEQGYNYCERLHIIIHGDERGV